MDLCTIGDSQGRAQGHGPVSGKPWSGKIAGLATALEAALSGKDTADVTLRICTGAAHILPADTDPAPTVYADVKALYDMRSSLVHGSVITHKELDKWLAAVSSVPEGRSPRTRIELAVDRLRDLVRGSILLRLLLNGDGRWSLRGGPPPPGQLFTDARIAEESRNAWHQGAADLGALGAAQPASALRDSIHHDYPGKGG